MTVETRKDNEELIIKPIGRLDSPAAAEFEEEIKEIFDNNTEFDSLTFDMSEVDYISSRGLRVLVAVYRRLDGKTLSIEGANQSVKEVMRLSGLQTVFNVKEA